MNTLFRKWGLYFFYWILVFIPVTLISQSDFRPGFILHKSGDTTFALVNYAKTSICEFRNNTQSQIYNPSDIHGFGFINDRYYSSQILKDTFVEVIIWGYLSLIKLQDKFYLLKEGNPITVLMPNEKFENGYVKWRGALKYIISDCGGIGNKADQLHYSEHELSNVVIDYNKCKNSNWIEYKSKLSALHISPGIGIGVATSTLIFNGGEKLRDYPYRFTMRDIFPGLVFDLKFPKYSRSISARLEFQLKRVKSSGEVISTLDKTEKYRETFLDASFIHLPVLVKYSFLQNKNEFSLLAGVFFDVFMTQSNRVITEDRFLNMVITEYNDSYYDFKNFQYGLTGGVNECIHLSKFSINSSLSYNIQAFYINSRQTLNKEDINFIRTPSLYNRMQLTFYIQKR